MYDLTEQADREGDDGDKTGTIPPGVKRSASIYSTQKIQESLRQVTQSMLFGACSLDASTVVKDIEEGEDKRLYLENQMRETIAQSLGLPLDTIQIVSIGE